MDALNNDLAPDPQDSVAGRVADFFHDAADRLSSAWHAAVGAAQQETSPALAAPAPASAAAGQPTQPRLHVVSPGETLSGIAQQAGTDWRSLARSNNITDPDHLKAGTLLHLPALPQAGPPHGAAAPTRPPAAQHVVQPGETLSGIAREAGTTWQNLARINHIGDPTELRAGTTLSLSGAASDLAGALPQAHPAAAPTPTVGQLHLGDLSMKYETGYTPGHEAQAAGVVSSGKNDPGGVSYGAYQFASSAAGGHQVQGFLKAEGAPWAASFSGKDPATPGGDFGVAWKQVAAQQPAEFYAAQHAYIARTHYQPVVDNVKADTGLDVSSRPLAVQNVVWSMSVQHGAARALVDRAVGQVGPQGSQSDSEYDRKLINTLYDVRDTYVDKIGNPGLKDRYVDERRDALNELAAP